MATKVTRRAAAKARAWFIHRFFVRVSSLWARHLLGLADPRRQVIDATVLKACLFLRLLKQTAQELKGLRSQAGVELKAALDGVGELTMCLEVVTARLDPRSSRRMLGGEVVVRLLRREGKLPQQAVVERRPKGVGRQRCEVLIFKLRELRYTGGLGSAKDDLF